MKRMVLSFYKWSLSSPVKIYTMLLNYFSLAELTFISGFSPPGL